MKIYFSPISSNSRKVLVTAAELGLTPELVKVDLAKGEQRKPDFLALNPSGKVPVLVDGELALPESHAIMAYLADKTAAQTLYPTDLQARAQVNRWMFWSANHWGPAISTLNWERVVKRILGQGEADPAQIARGEALFADFARVLDAHLATREWLAGPTLTLADISVGCPLMVVEQAQLPVAPFANVKRWFARFQQTEGWKRAST